MCQDKDTESLESRKKNACASIIMSKVYHHEIKSIIPRLAEKGIVLRINDLQGKEKGQISRNEDLSIFAPPRGLEPRTP